MTQAERSREAVLHGLCSEHKVELEPTRAYHRGLMRCPACERMFALEEDGQILELMPAHEFAGMANVLLGDNDLYLEDGSVVTTVQWQAAGLTTLPLSLRYIASTW